MTKFFKRIVLILLCSSMVFTCTGCKKDNLKPLKTYLKENHKENAAKLINSIEEVGINGCLDFGPLGALTILQIAIKDENPQFVKACLDSGADPNVGVVITWYGQKSETLTSDIALETKNIEILDMCFNAGMTLNADPEKFANLITAYKNEYYPQDEEDSLNGRESKKFREYIVKKLSEEQLDFSKVDKYYDSSFSFYPNEDRYPVFPTEYLKFLYENKVKLPPVDLSCVIRGFVFDREPYEDIETVKNCISYWMQFAEPTDRALFPIGVIHGSGDLDAQNPDNLSFIISEYKKNNYQLDIENVYKTVNNFFNYRLDLFCKILEAFSAGGINFKEPFVDRRGNTNNLYELCIKNYSSGKPGRVKYRIECIKYMHEHGFSLNEDSPFKMKEESLLK